MVTILLHANIKRMSKQSDEQYSTASHGYLSFAHAYRQGHVRTEVTNSVQICSDFKFLYVQACETLSIFPIGDVYLEDLCQYVIYIYIYIHNWWLKKQLKTLLRPWPLCQLYFFTLRRLECSMRAWMLLELQPVSVATVAKSPQPFFKCFYLKPFATCIRPSSLFDKHHQCCYPSL